MNPFTDINGTLRERVQNAETQMGHAFAAREFATLPEDTRKFLHDLRMFLLQTSWDLQHGPEFFRKPCPETGESCGCPQGVCNIQTLVRNRTL